MRAHEPGRELCDNGAGASLRRPDATAQHDARSTAVLHHLGACQCDCEINPTHRVALDAAGATAACAFQRDAVDGSFQIDVLGESPAGDSKRNVVG